MKENPKKLDLEKRFESLIDEAEKILSEKEFVDLLGDVVEETLSGNFPYMKSDNQFVAERIVEMLDSIRDKAQSLKNKMMTTFNLYGGFEYELTENRIKK